jgi:hypothetical protein
MSDSCQRCQRFPVATSAVGLQVCLPCSKVLSTPSLPAFEDQYTESWCWQCRCSAQFYNGETQCPQCLYVQLGLFKDPISISSSPAEGLTPGQFATQRWVCQNCQYQYNMKLTCENCGLPQQSTNVDPQGMQPRAHGCKTCPKCSYEYNLQDVCVRCQFQLPCNAPTSQPLTAMPQAANIWRCFKCGFSNNSSAKECQSCHQQSDRPPTSTWKCRYCTKVQEQPNSNCVACKNILEAETWKCFGCAENNPALLKVCNYCNGSKDLGLYLLSRGVRLSADNREWECECQATTPVYLPTCSCCKKASEVVPKALKHNGNGLNVVARVWKRLTH